MGGQQLRAESVHEEDADAADSGQVESDPIGLTVHSQSGQYRGNEIGQRTMAVLRSEQHALTLRPADAERGRMASKQACDQAICGAWVRRVTFVESERHGHRLRPLGCERTRLDEGA